MFIDNFFTSLKLLVDLEVASTYGYNTIGSNRVGIPKSLTDKKILQTPSRNFGLENA